MPGPTRLVQLDHPVLGRRVALVYGDELHLLGTYRSLYQFAQVTLDTGYKLRDLLSTDLSGIVLDYGQVWELKTEWRFLPSFDHPGEPGRCIVSGSGRGWFYKGSGVTLFGHGEVLAVPDFASAGAEGPALAAVYVIDKDGTPRRVGLTPGNEFGDAEGHAHWRLFPCSIGPELWVEAEFDEIRGVVKIRRKEQSWSADLVTGEPHAAQGLEKAEADLFRHAIHRRPGDVHIHFLGAREPGNGCGIDLQNDDDMTISWDGFGRPLVNRVGKASALLPSGATPL